MLLSDFVYFLFAQNYSYYLVLCLFFFCLMLLLPYLFDFSFDAIATILILFTKIIFVLILFAQNCLYCLLLYHKPLPAIYLLLYVQCILIEN